jgi:hypothetical protein
MVVTSPFFISRLCKNTIACVQPNDTGSLLLVVAACRIKNPVSSIENPVSEPREFKNLLRLSFIFYQLRWRRRVV